MYRNTPPRLKGNEVSGLLAALEDAALSPNVHLIDLHKAFGWENWRAFKNVYGRGDKPFAERDHFDLSVQLMNAESIARFTKSAYEVDTIVNILHVLTDFATGLQAKFKIPFQSLVSKLSKGINSLPEELLAKIFQISVWGEGKEGGTQAVRISHVCRAFRSIALGKRGLWTTLSSKMSGRYLETFISRAGPNEDFHTFYHSSTNIGAHMDSFEIICKPILSRWKSLTVTPASKWYDGKPERDGVATIIGVFIGFIIGSGLQFPALEELTIEGDRSDRYYDNTRNRASYTVAPNLCTLRCSFFLPYLSVNLSSVSTFILSHSFGGDRSGFARAPSITPLLESLRTMPNLASFELEAYDANEAAYRTRLPKYEFPSIISFHLRLDRFPILDFRLEHSCIAVLMHTVHMPSLEALSISIGAAHFKTDKNNVDSTKWSQSLFHLSWLLLPDQFANSTLLTSLFFKVWDNSDYSGVDEPTALPDDTNMFYVPLDRTLHIQKMVISSFVPVIFGQASYDGVFVTASYVESCWLQELTFVGCENMTLGHLKETVRCLDSLGIWNHLERVAVQSCKHLVYEEVEELVGKEWLQFSS
ncbi:hypothetical protein SCHPADRAFT_1001046 [Schizopora paradoxa]|uniref:Uncharacterized protein n=1 Tax=Schizopora paradoxa TaxID=27342 RepID=A0A0H2RTY2_9AGAM|nr:hypothetical protein SCHPADRAFT_1001046 [Schizopora paradoxa]